MRQIIRNDLSEIVISRLLTRFKGQVVVKDCVSSTQNLVKNCLKQGLKQPLAIMADCQTAAYGKAGRPFYAPRHDGLYLSLVWPNEKANVAMMGRLTTGIGVGLVRALHHFYPLAKFKLKWVNDVYLQRKKVAGILTEAISYPGKHPGLAVGIGINLTNANFPREFASIAGAIAPGQPIDRNQLAADLLDQLTLVHSCYRTGTLLKEYRRFSLLLGRRVRLVLGSMNLVGRVIAIDDEARLVIQDDHEKIHHLVSGDVSKVYF